MSNVCLREEVEIDWWIVEGKEKIGEGGGHMKKAREVDRWTDRWWERRIRKMLCRLSRTRRTTGEKSVGAEPGDSSQHRHCPTHLHFLFPLLFYSSFFWGIFISQGSLLYPTHTHTITHTLRTTGAVELSPLGQAVNEDKVVSMLCSSYLCWRRHAAWAPC